MEGTEAIRELAPRWSLAGDEKLLNVLQSTHQKIVSKCREINTKLEEMTSGLDQASIKLQNVNNRFMALSNSKFIESRVYDDDDDDGDVTTENKPPEGPTNPEVMDEVSLMKRSLAILDRAHQVTEILDESDSDSDLEISVVLKPRDLYEHRPLPYIIGSQSWRNKWHAGLVLEESESESETDKHARESEYSESEEERLVPDANMSESSASLQSERGAAPADVAAELAARLGNAPPRVLEEPEDLPQPISKPVYRPQNPISSTIFPDEPPPIEDLSDKEDDIFAEISRKQPYNEQREVDELFGDELDISKEAVGVKQKSRLFLDEPEPELFEQPKVTKGNQNTTNDDDVTAKKPVGGISLFGSNKGTESIGAAILNRNRRKSSSSDNERDSTIRDSTISNIKNNAANDYSQEANNANYIFDNLFAKAKQAEQKMVKPKLDRPEEKKKEVEDVKDLFSDNIFDDIDDIFTSNIKILSKEGSKNAKSIFDDDDDGLFSEVAKMPKVIAKDTKTASSSSKKSIFDGDDLFGDVKINQEANKSKKPKKANKPQKAKVALAIAVEANNNTKIFSNPPESKESKIKPKAKSKSIFDSDSDDNLFSDVKKKSIDKVQESIKNNENDILGEKETTLPINTLETENTKVFQSPSLFEEDEIDDLFINANKAKAENTIIEHKLPENIPDFDQNDTTKEITKVKDVQEKSKLNKETIKEYDNLKPNISSKKDDKSDEFKDNLLVKEKNDNTEVTSAVNDVISFSQANVQSSINMAAQTKNELVNNIATKDVVNETLSPKPQELFSGNKVVENEVPVIKEQDVIPEPEIPISIAAFDDIFSEPPAFEKAKEVKKITNVNALFEDDSDDEALFFKKNDVISDEKPELFSPSANFGIFNDEPPALFDFDPKNTKTDDNLFILPKTEVNPNVIRSEHPGLVEISKKELPIPAEKSTQELFDDDTLFSSPETSKFDVKTVKTYNVLSKDKDDIFGDVTKTEPNNDTKEPKSGLDQLDDVRDINEKKIGKLDTKNFNINVEALVPGASPKKTPKDLNENAYVDNTKETEEIEPKSAENLPKIENVEPKIEESISFESKPESGVLDNNLSKKRAKIQVKRRPSSRRARHEAVRKSVIDLDDDTDNSSSFDEPLPNLKDAAKEKSNEAVNQKEIAKTSAIDQLESEKEFDEHKTQDDSIKDFENEPEKYEILSTSLNKLPNELNKHEKQDKLTVESSDINTDNEKDDFDDMFKSNDRKKGIINIHEEITKDVKNIDEDVSNVDTNESKDTQIIGIPEQSTTKVVYILNDEDIFSNTTTNSNKKENNERQKEIFKNTEDVTKTIGSTYKNTSEFEAKNDDPKPSILPDANSKTVQPEKETKSLFDLSDGDDDLFGRSKTKKVEVKSKLFDSDSEDDLFSSKKKVKEVKQKEVKKASLFGDDDDDDDLFGTKTKTVPESTKAAATRSVPKEVPKSTEIVFNDPLSMLDDD